MLQKKKISPLVYALRCRFYCFWWPLYTTARLNAAQIFAVDVGVRLPLLLLLVLLLHYGEVKCCSNFRPGVGVMLGVNAAHFTAMDVGITLPQNVLLVFGADVYAAVRRVFFL